MRPARPAPEAATALLAAPVKVEAGAVAVAEVLVEEETEPVPEGALVV